MAFSAFFRFPISSLSFVPIFFFLSNVSRNTLDTTFDWSFQHRGKKINRKIFVYPILVSKNQSPNPMCTIFHLTMSLFTCVNCELCGWIAGTLIQSEINLIVDIVVIVNSNLVSNDITSWSVLVLSLVFSRSFYFPEVYYVYFHST